MSEGSGSRLPERFGAFAALLGSSEADVSQQAIIQVTQVLTRESSFAPKDECRDEGGPGAKPLCLARRGEHAKPVSRARVDNVRHLFLSLIHSFHA